MSLRVARRRDRHAEHVHPVPEAGLLRELDHGLHEVRADAVQIPGRLVVDQHARAVGRLPQEHGRLLERPAAARVVVLHARPRHDRGHRLGMAEGVGLPVDGDVFGLEAELSFMNARV